MSTQLWGYESAYFADRKAQLPEKAFGVSVGLAITLPLLGRSLVVSGQTLSTLATVTAFLAFLFCKHDFRIGRTQLTAFGLIVLYVMLVAMSAFPEQWDFLLQPSNWRGHADHYLTAKLTVFLIKTIPAITLAVMFAVLKDRESAIKFMLLSMFASSLAAFAVLIISSGNLIRAPYEAAADWYNGVGRAEFSTISMGMILIIGALSALAFLNEKPLRNLIVSVFVGLCLLATIMLDRRIDTVLFLIAIGVMIGYRYIRHPKSRRALLPAFAILLTPMTLWPLVTNDFNIEYWQTAPSGFRYRVDAFQNVVEFATTETHQTVGAPEEIRALQQSAEIRGAVAKSKFLWGGGLGLYALRVENGLLYPHNIVLETYLEVGAVAAVVLLVALALLMAHLARKMFRGTLTPGETATAAIATVLFLISLKSGDISSAGNILFFTIVAGTAAQLPDAQIYAESTPVVVSSALSK